MQIENINKIIPENFFLLLNGRNIGFYVRVMVDIRDMLDSSDSFSIAKTDVYAIISQNIAICQPKEEDEWDENGKGKLLTTTHGTPLTKEHVYNRIRHCGWIQEEASDDTRFMTVVLSSFARSQISCLESAMTLDEIYIGNYRHTIEEKFRDLIARKYSRPYLDAIKPIMECCEGINAAQNHIHDRFKQTANEIIRLPNRKDTIDKIHEGMDELNSGDAHKLLLEEGLFPSAQQDIAEYISCILNDENIMEWIVRDLMKARKSENEDDAWSEIWNDFKKVESCLCINFLHKTNDLCGTLAGFLDTMKSKVQMLSENDGEILSRITNLLMHISNMSEEEYDENVKTIDLFRKLVGVNEIAPGVSLVKYTPKTRQEIEQGEMAPIEECDDITPTAVGSDLRLTCKYTNDLVAKWLDGNKSFSSKQIQISSREEMDELVAVILNSYSDKSSYSIKYNDSLMDSSDEYATFDNDETCESSGYKFPSFVISLKGEKE